MIKRINNIHEVTPMDVEWLHKATCYHYGGYSPISVAQDFSQELVQLWRLTGDAEGILVTNIDCHPKGKELNILWLAGKNYIKVMKEIKTHLEVFARENGCRWMGGIVNRPGLERIYARAFQPVFRDKSFNIEVDYGRTSKNT